jgi:predicted phosphoadenosine phosphosulfate sulfurtransferase
MAIFPAFIYKWALENALESDKILAWRVICYKYYLAETLYPDNPTKRVAYQMTLQLKTMRLCEPPTDLKRLMIRAKRIAEVAN